MSAPTFTVLQTKPVPRGTDEFEVKRAAILKEFADKVPTEYYIPKSILDSIELDVSGIPAKCSILSPEELRITEDYDASGLAEAIASRKLTAVAVAKAFCKRAIIAHQLTCCLTQWFMDEAIQQAQKLDEYLVTHGKTVGPLHGVPISIKDHMGIAGTYTSGASLYSIVKATEDVHFIRVLREAGAVFYCKTNQPQSLMHLESDSLWGRVLNPYNINLSAGGSTGGEAALIAMKGSVLGIGSDIGGSIRGPSAFCGIYGFKPTSYVLPFDGMLLEPFPGELNILCAPGPMGRSVRDLNLVTKTVLATQPHLIDPRLIPIPWTGTETPIKGPLRIGLIEHDGFVDPQPPVKRAIAWAREVLSDPKYAGLVEVKDFKVYGAAEAMHKIRKMYFPDGGASTCEAITSTGEPIHHLTTDILKDAAEDGMCTAVDLGNMRADRDDFRMKFLRSWQDQEVDVVLGPAFVGPASAHDTAYTWTYTSLYNFVDYPGVVIPTPVVAKAGEKYDASYKPLSPECERVNKLWGETNFEGAPINLQMVARKYHDNQLFGALEVLKDILQLS